jgi:hypothetical protein
MSRFSRARIGTVALLLFGTLIGGVSIGAETAAAQPSVVIAGGTWCC